MIDPSLSHAQRAAPHHQSGAQCDLGRPLSSRRRKGPSEFEDQTRSRDLDRGRIAAGSDALYDPTR
jgi:hypothetical protein